MVTIEFTAIPDEQGDYELLLELLADFRKQTGIEVKLTRMDELIRTEHPLRPVMIQLVSSSRAYRTIPLWRRIENQFGQELAPIARALFDNKDADWDTLLTEAMNSLTHRLNLTLE
jgi:hypothetical protein